MSNELLRLRCRGHAEVRGTHAKTVEFTSDADITGRATCVVGVAAEAIGPADPAIAGPLRITMTSGEHRAVLHATGNSRWRPGSAAVVRLSSERLPGTLATDADTSAADLPRELMRTLADPTAELDVRIERAPGPPGGVLVRYRAQPDHDRRLAVECAAADLVIAEDIPSRAVIAEHGAELGLSSQVVACLAEGGRVLAVSTAGLADPTVLAVLAGPDRPAVEVLGLPPELAVSAVSPQRAPVLLATATAPREVPRLVGSRPEVAVVFGAPAAELPKILAEVDRQAAGPRTAAVAVATTSGAERPSWGRAAELRLPRRGELLCRVDAVTQPGGEVPAVDPAGLVTALLADSVSTRTVALALAGQPGWSRKQAYDFVLAVSGKQPK
ncbi:DUF371 domain-containing protein [Actinoalloteichus hymeniacidonis]|uniref:DUF371 domain-containing protein n=1 Tax=Actinoalloteichus hymeniacidonis TaxID=340345 RepID=A0AAC9MX81_9PSEU|nr:DUF371 domain-containing protein [Actinoalloteichus hymeniacidonis]AOS61994.1 hypothetical protein TL08_05845 [Actinoalloteichus hymeniacidonis]MBB5909984.1 hypothetical protein [Actinoalloteichus hymeniacidonis]